MFTSASNTSRARELDFLRGVAIVLVLLRHDYLFQATKNMGWIGVDLFFVLSGFLVSGLLFKEYLDTGEMHPVRFLIRRGFKIYPLFYLSLAVFCMIVIPQHKFEWKGFLGEFFFMQNYVSAFGWSLFDTSWSLAIEEHFYVGLALTLTYLVRRKMIKLKVDHVKLGQAEIILLSMMVLCLLFRFASNLILPSQAGRNFTMTHLRIDSLLAGVLVSYWYYFRFDFFKQIFSGVRKWLIPAALLLLAYTPFIDPVYSFFVKTIGFLFNYMAFASVLIYFLLTTNINQQLNRVFSKPIVDLVSRMGVASYSIYIVHLFTNILVARVYSGNRYLVFALSFSAAVIAGMILTQFFEKFFLRIRDRYFPARMNKQESTRHASINSA